jgi:acyl-CoA synthetase (AMP-forming)/AMP-acid ligase II
MGLWDELTDPRKATRTFWAWDGADFRQETIGEELLRARRVAAGLKKRGVRPGDIVPAVITNGPDATPGFGGIWIAGATIASLPIIARGMSIEAYVAQLDALCELIGSPFFLAEERFLAFLPPDAKLRATPVGYGELIESPDPAPIELPDLDSTVFVQFSSGTTGEPRGVELTGRAIEAQMRMLAQRLEIDPERDVGYMWLPLSHDMGFFGCSLLALYTGMRGVRATPERFLQSPRTWFEDCARFGATVTAGPPSALHFATRAEQARPSGDPLSLRLCLVGAEQVEWDVLAAAAETFAPRGLRAEAFTVAYGLAETTLAVTLGEPTQAPRYISVDAETLAGGTVSLTSDEDPRARKITSVGAPIGATTVEIDPLTHEVVVGSPSLAEGYLGQPQATAERFREATVRTHDLGFLHDGELFLIGRSDDVLILGGRNVYVQQLEREMEAQDGIRAGNCAIVDAGDGFARGRPRIGVVAELAAGATDGERVADCLRELAMTLAGLPIDDVVFLDRGAFPKTPSGKIQRYRCRELLRGWRAGDPAGAAGGGAGGAGS